MTLLSKEDILNADDREYRLLNVPKWGGEVRISTMSGFARDRFESSLIGANGGQNMQNIRAKLVAACVVDSDDNLLFTEAEVKKLGNKSSVALDMVFGAAQELNKITDTDVDDLAKN